jgi:hypothetical protein
VRGGGVLPELTYKTTIMAFGQYCAAELSYLVGLCVPRTSSALII